MAIINPGMNPISSQFTAKAVNVASKGMATLKTNTKDVKVRDEQKELNDLGDDQVQLSNAGKLTAGKQAMLADQSGATGETAKKKRKESTKDAGELKMFGDAEEAKKKGEAAKTVSQEETSSDEIEPASKSRVNRLMSQDPREIMEREPAVPEQFQVAAQKMVENQMVNDKPTNKLTDIKDVPDPELALPALKPLDNVEIAGIHDTNNRPIPMQMDTSADAAS